MFPWERTQRQGACLIWTGATDQDGYGYFKRKGVRARRAHRAVYEIVLGLVPKVLMHSCDRRNCVALQHLSPGTPRLNVKDMIDKGRRGKPFPGSSDPARAFRGRPLGAKDKTPRHKRSI